jgi:hypothetical protein
MCLSHPIFFVEDLDERKRDASGGFSRTSVLSRSEEPVMEHEVPNDVMAQRCMAAHDAVMEVLEVINRRREDLSHVPAGRALVERFDRIRPLWSVGTASRESGTSGAVA